MIFRHSDLLAFGRTTRAMTMIFVLAFCGGLMALMPWATAALGDDAAVQQMRISAAAAGADDVRQAIKAQHSLGRTCIDEPALTDTVVFEWTRGEVEVLTFDQAFDASTRKAGWVRAYCS